MSAQWVGARRRYLLKALKMARDILRARGSFFSGGGGNFISMTSVAFFVVASLEVLVPGLLFLCSFITEFPVR